MKFVNPKAYLKSLSKEQRATIEPIRKLVKKLAPKAKETVSYQILGYRYHGLLVCVGGFKDHCSFFPCSGSVANKFKGKLKGFKLARGTIQFTREKQIPKAILTAMIKQRIKENESGKK